MYRKYVYSGTTWFDIVSADTTELLEIARLYDLDDQIVRTLANNNSTPSFYDNNQCVVVSMNFPSIDIDKGENTLHISAHKVSFIVGKNFIISSRFSDAASFKYIKREFRKYTISKELFPTFFLNIVLLFLYQDVLKDIQITIPEKKQKHRMAVPDSYLKDYGAILSEHKKMLQKLENNSANILQTKQSSLKAARTAYEQVRTSLQEQENVCISCLKQNNKNVLERVYSLMKRSKV